MIELTLNAVKTLPALLPVLARSVNAHGAIPFGADFSDDAHGLIVALRQLGDIKAPSAHSVARIARELMTDDWKVQK